MSSDADEPQGFVSHRRPHRESEDDSEVTKEQKSRRRQVPIVILLFHAIFIVLIGVFVRYTPYQAIMPFNPKNLSAVEAEKHAASSDGQFIDTYYPIFQDVQVMVFIGFGYLIAFMKFFSITSIAMNFMLGCFALEWAILMNGWFTWIRHPERTNVDYFEGICGWGMDVGAGHCTPLDIKSMTEALFAGSTVLITCGVLLGKITPTQMVINAVLEVAIYALNRWLVVGLLDVSDCGHSLTVHAFGAYWGLAAAMLLNRKKLKGAPGAQESYANELFVLLGTLFMFIYWPSWNSAKDVGIERHRAAVNTFLAIAASCVTAFAISASLDKKGRFTVKDLQNASLAGGVGIGSIANATVYPFGALIIGTAAGLFSVLGYHFITPVLNRIGAHDSSGAHNLHGIPALLSAVVSAIVAATATAKTMGSKTSLNTVFNAMASEEERSKVGSAWFVHDDAKYGDFPEAGRDQGFQGGLQFAGFLISVVIAIVGGALSGVLLRFLPIDKPDDKNLADDSIHFFPHWAEPTGGDEKVPLHKKSMYAMRLDDDNDKGSEKDEDETSFKKDDE